MRVNCGLQGSTQHLTDGARLFETQLGTASLLPVLFGQGKHTLPEAHGYSLNICEGFFPFGSL